MEDYIPPKVSRRQAIHLMSVIVGLGLLMLEVNIYRLTFISIYVPISISLLVMIATTIPSRKSIIRIYPKYGVVFPFILNLASWGFIACYIFMASNFFFAEKNGATCNLKIEGKGVLLEPTRHHRTDEQYIQVNYLGNEKQLVFHYLYSAQIKTADSVKITVRKGALGFEIIDKYELF